MSAEESLPRSVIAQSWRRAELSGIDPGSRLEDTRVDEVDRHSRLAVAARPVLDEIASVLEGTRFAVILADQESRLVDTRFGESALRDRLERMGLVRGRVFSEETVGTNSIATALRVGHGLSVRGPEHYLKSLQALSCYGYPITHPITRRTQGVVDMTCFIEHDNALLAPFLIHAAQQVE
ncbi:GAF domain-containing protein, partial [Nocardia gipuzkoensis]